MSPEAINLKTLRERAEERIELLGGGGMGVNPETVLALIDVAEAAIDNAHHHNRISHRLAASLARFTTGENE